MYSDVSLFAALQHGDDAAFDTLFRRWYPVLCAYARKFVSTGEAEEIVQDTLLWLWENRGGIVIETSLGAYLFKSVYRRALNAIRKNKVILSAETAFCQERFEHFYDIDPVRIKELTKRIRAAIEALPDSYREAFVLHRFSGMNYKEIAERLKVSPKTIDYRICQALKLLRKNLKDCLLFSLLCYCLSSSLPEAFRRREILALTADPISSEEDSRTSMENRDNSGTFIRI